MPALGQGFANTSWRVYPPFPIVMLGFHRVTPFESHRCAVVSSGRAQRLFRDPKNILEGLEEQTQSRQTQCENLLCV